MSKLALIRSERPPVAAMAPWLGPAVVTGKEGGRLAVQLADGSCAQAALALPVPYDACVGDSVLVIGNDEGHYVIGVLHGQGRTVLELAGSVELRAQGGPLRLASDQCVEIDAPEIELRARRMRTVADAVVEKFTTLRQRVSELWSTHAGQSHSVTDGASIAQADTTAIVSRGKVTINGKAIHLG